MQGQEYNPDPAFEERLKEALRDRLSHKNVEIPETVDRVVFALIDEKVQEIQTGKRSFWDRRTIFYPLAAAALLLLAVTVSLEMSRQDVVPRPPGVPGMAQVPFHAGAPDIVDAYLLSMRIKNEDATTLADDVDGDGLVDRQDVEELARRAVSLETYRGENGV